MASALNWFEIPANDIARARTFYETIFGVTLEKIEAPGREMYSWPGDWQKGDVGGCIAQGEGSVPSATGTIVYLNANPDLQVVAERVEPAGGKLLMPKTAIGMDVGYMAVIADPEGNTVGLHSMG